MKTYFSFSLKGKEWWKPFLLYWILYIILSSPSQRFSQERMFVGANPGVATGVNVLFSIGLFILQILFTIVFLRIIMPKLSVDGKSFSFRGNMGSYLKIHIRGILLTIVTLAIYAPWYARRVTAYLMSESSYNDESPEFLGRGGRLFKYFLLAFLIPIIVLVGIFAAAVYSSSRGEWMDSSFDTLSSASFQDLFSSLQSSAVIGLAVSLGSLLVVVLIPFIYLVYKWYVDLRWRDIHISWKTSFWPSCGFILGQLLLTVITVGIYWPAAVLRLFRYFAGRTVFCRGEHVAGRLGFESAVGKGFGLIWGQGLLCLITLGIYIPWAVERIGTWAAAETFYEGSDSF